LRNNSLPEVNVSNHRYDKRYEHDNEQYPPELVGVHPMGDGGLVEYPYRHYFELKHVNRIVRFTKDMNVLEVGSGNGRWVMSIAPFVKHYTGVDSDHEGMTIARAGVERLGITNVDLKEMDIGDFKGERPYDLIYFSGVCEFLEDDQIHDALKNVSPYFTSRTMILDRSTTNHKQPSVERVHGGFYTYRTPKQLQDMFGKHGFVLQYQNRSYRPLRGGRFVSKSPLEATIRRLVESTRPASFYLMHSLSFLADIIHPTQIASKGVSHDFSLFSRQGYSNI
jgi:SAM-dependent methyltransferase